MIRDLIILLTAYLLILASPHFATAQIQVPEDYSTIQKAIDSAESGSTIRVSNGTYNENIEFPEKGYIEVIGITGPKGTVIDGQGKDRVLEFNSTAGSSDSVLIKGFTIRNGDLVSEGAGVYIEQMPVVMRNVRIINNTAQDVGGGIAVRNGDIYLFDSKVSVNGQEGVSGIFFESAYGWFENSVISNNKAEGIEGKNSSIYIKQSVIKGNSYEGIKANNSSINIRNSVVKGNLDRGLRTDTLTKIFDSSIWKNEGGGFVVGGRSIFNNVYIKGNNSPGAGIIQGNTTLKDVYVIDNKLYQYGSSKCILNLNVNKGAEFENVIIWNNDGYGVCTNTYVENFTILKNQSGIYVNSADSVEIKNNTIITSGQGIYFESTNESFNGDFSQNNIVKSRVDAPTFYEINGENNWWGHRTGPYNREKNSNGEGSTIEGNIDFDPWLESPSMKAPPIPPLNFKIANSADSFIKLKWDSSKIADLKGYNVYYENDTSSFDFQNKITLRNGNHSSKIENLNSSHPYSFVVTSVDMDGNESWYMRKIETDLNIDPPSEFDLNSPEDGQTGVSQIPVFDWENATDPDPADTVSYKLKVSKDSSFNEIIREATVTEYPQYQVSELPDNTRYFWTVIAFDDFGLQTSSDTLSFVVGELTHTALNPDLPESFKLYKPYPSPFNPTTTIKYDLPKASEVSVRVYNILGRHIRTLVDEQQSAGTYRVRFKAGNLPSGQYLIRMQSGSGFVSEKSVMLIK